ncbi:hypothetical protein ACLB9X_11845 [Streptomyces sp. 5K101]
MRKQGAWGQQCVPHAREYGWDDSLYEDGGTMGLRVRGGGARD